MSRQIAYRNAEYFRQQLPATNSSAPQWLPVSITAPNETAVNGNIFVPQTPEQFTYDADGNLLSDGRFNYTWDAENRLIQVQSLSSSPTASKRMVTWEFDAQGRRIRQTTYDGSSGSYVVTEDLKFLSDGWRNIAELNATNNALVRSFLWGLDLSGTMDGAGGVGGLLMINSAANGAHFFAYDGNGNVVALVKASDGTVSARYEYDPFGSVLRSTGLMAAENRFQFSTKRNDRTTDLQLYEYRARRADLSWLSRDPVEEGGGDNVYGFVCNRPTSSSDFLGLWSPADHKTITSDALVLAVATIKPGASAACLSYVRDTILKENADQDLSHYADLRRHYNRAVVPAKEDYWAVKLKADKAYEAYIRDEYTVWFEMQEKPSVQNCQRAIAALGRISHSHEDFFAHAIRRDGQGGVEPGSPSSASGWIAWTATPPVVGDPDRRFDFWPSSYSINGGGEHPPFSEPLVHGGPEYTARFKAAKHFELGVFTTVLPIWFDKCKCVCK